MDQPSASASPTPAAAVAALDALLATPTRVKPASPNDLGPVEPKAAPAVPPLARAPVSTTQKLGSDPFADLEEVLQSAEDATRAAIEKAQSGYPFSGDAELQRAYLFCTERGRWTDAEFFEQCAESIEGMAGPAPTGTELPPAEVPRPESSAPLATPPVLQQQVVVVDPARAPADPLGECADPFCLTETGIAQRFAAQHGRAVRFVPEWAAWVEYDGVAWHRVPESTLIKRAIRTARSLPDEAKNAPDLDIRTRFLKASIAAESANKIASILKIARGLVSTPASAFDRDPYLLNVANGTLDLRRGELLPHNRADMLTRLAPVEHDPAATCPTWDAFLQRIFLGRSELIGFIQRALGYCLTGSVDEQVFLFLHGAGANGKSVLLGLMHYLLGSYAVQGAPDLLLAKLGEAHPVELAQIEGARLVICSEVDEGRAFNESRLKALTGKEPVSARGMRENFHTFLPTWKLALAANEKPHVRGGGMAFWRRVRLVPFDVVIPPAERDPRLLEKLQDEAPGILAQLVRACAEWQAHGLGSAPEVQESTAAYEQEQDRLGAFVDEACLRSPDGWISGADLHAAYQAWAQRSRERPLHRLAFRDRMLALGFAEKRQAKTGARGWAGLRLQSSTLAATLHAARFSAVSAGEGDRVTRGDADSRPAHG